MEVQFAPSASYLYHLFGFFFILVLTLPANCVLLRQVGNGLLNLSHCEENDGNFTSPFTESKGKTITAQQRVILAE